MNDTRWRERLESALLSAATRAMNRPEYESSDTAGKYRLIALDLAEVIEDGDRPQIEAALEATRTPGFLEVNDEIWKATGKVVTLHVNVKSRVVERVSLEPQPDREVD